MFAKIFTQIFDSSIADNWQHRHVFEDLLKLADQRGMVDMTPEAIIARTRLPETMVREGLSALSEPDPRSRSKEEQGRRIVLIDPERDWGWRIVNYPYYRGLKTEFDRTEYMRNYMRDKRERETVKPKSNKSNKVKLTPSASVSSSPSVSSLNPGECEGEWIGTVQTAPPRLVSLRKPASVQEAITKGQMIGVSEPDARAWFNDCEQCDWRRGDGTPFDNWPRQMVIHRDQIRSRPRNGNGSQNGHDHRAERAAKEYPQEIKVKML